MIDIANQVTQQNAHKTSTCEPYIAAIVGPYNKKLATCQSSMTWFYVQHEAGRIPAEDENPLQAGCSPMELQVGSRGQPWSPCCTAVSHILIPLDCGQFT